MRRIGTFLVVALACTAFFWRPVLRAADLVNAKDGSGVYGYKDTPRLPWCQWLVHDPDRPNPPKVDPGTAGPPAAVPADAVVLFDGHDVSQWTPLGDWKLEGGLLVSGDGHFATKASYGSIQLHVEWMGPAHFDGPPGQQRSVVDGGLRDPSV